MREKRSPTWAKPGLRIQIAEVVLDTVLEGNVLTAEVPLSLISEAGKKPLVIIGADGGVRSDPVFLEVVAFQDQVPPTQPLKTSAAQLEPDSDA